MKKNQKNLGLLYVLFATFLVTANAVASKVFNTGVVLFGSPVTLTVGAVCYPFTFLITDVIGEIWGKAESKTAVFYGFVAQVVSTIFIIGVRFFNPVDKAVQDAFEVLLGQNWVFVTASLSAFLVSQSWDVFVFHKIRNKYIAKHKTRKGGRWIWNNLSTVTSQLFDTVIYVVIAFGFGFKWLFNSETQRTLLMMIIGQYLFKAIIALLDTPIFYLLTRKENENEN